jgi:hypothetical protein
VFLHWWQSRLLRAENLTFDFYSILSRDHGFLNALLLEAKKSYMAADEHNISIYIADS